MRTTTAIIGVSIVAAAAYVIPRILHYKLQREIFLRTMDSTSTDTASPFEILFTPDPGTNGGVGKEGGYV